MTAKIIIEKDGKEPEVFEDVVQFTLVGIKGKVIQEDFYTYQGVHKHMMEKVHSIYLLLKEAWFNDSRRN